MSPSLLDIPAFLAYMSKRVLCRVATGEKRVALTFDDGPHPRYTPELLEMLEAKGIRATFFVVGRRVRQFGKVLERTFHAGHEIGNHSDRHVPLSLLPGGFIRREIAVAEKLIVEVTGERPSFLRPPMGWFDQRVLDVARHMGYRPVVGSIHPRDSRKPGTGVIVDRIRRRVEPGAIIILHDGGRWINSDRSQTVAAVDRITDDLVARGYRFETLSQLAAAPDAASP
ncbi:MAG: polysaccharide deacetylase family protein [Candidatus Krumholzibacteriia bacterium]